MLIQGRNPTRTFLQPRGNRCMEGDFFLSFCRDYACPFYVLQNNVTSPTFCHFHQLWRSSNRLDPLNTHPWLSRLINHRTINSNPQRFLKHWNLRLEIPRTNSEELYNTDLEAYTLNFWVRVSKAKTSKVKTYSDAETWRAETYFEAKTLRPRLWGWNFKGRDLLRGQKFKVCDLL